MASQKNTHYPSNPLTVTLHIGDNYERFVGSVEKLRDGTLLVTGVLGVQQYIPL